MEQQSKIVFVATLSALAILVIILLIIYAKAAPMIDDLNDKYESFKRSFKIK